MSPRGSQSSRGDSRSGGRRTSVVGSTIGDVSSRLRRRGLPLGGIRERDGLKVAEGALPESTTVSSADGRTRVRSVLRIVAIVSGSLAALLLVFALVIMALSHTDLFTISSIETYDSEHVSADVVGRPAELGGGETLLNVDVDSIENKVKKNPWVASVEVTRLFPDTLRIEVHERSLGSLVAMSSGGIAWMLGDDGVWIEPMRVQSGDDESTIDVALAEAERLGVILISDVPTTVNPVAGTLTTDSAISAVSLYRQQLSPAFQEQVVSYSAASEDDISCILKNGVEVSMGSVANIETKESVAQRILDEYQGQVTYINVRTPSRPTYRRINSSFVHEGTGATGSSLDTESRFGVVESQDADDEKMESQTEGAGNVDTVTTDTDASASAYDDISGDAYGIYDEVGGYGEAYGYDDYSSYGPY